MVNKNRLSAVLLSLSVLSATASAECFVRTATVSKGQTKLQRIADIKYTKLPYNGLRKCIATLRVQVDSQWEDAEGEGVAETDAQACAMARDILKVQYLAPVDPENISAESSMVCTDAPKVNIREKVKIGDWVQESEVMPFRQFPKPFKHNGTTCKWFSYREAHQGRPVGFAGVMCMMQSNQWQVVDLF
jgi:hypothetical protein